jgi:hypothetical protein
MTKEELAEALNGNEYRKEISPALADQAKAYGLVVVYGASDDLMEFEGAISDEVGCYDGGTAFILDGKLLGEDDCESHCKWFKAAQAKAIKVKALWCEEDPYSWTYRTDIPHASFDILEDGARYCRGIVFDLKDAR